MRKLRYGILVTLAVVVLAGASCAPAVAPSPTAAPSRPAVTTPQAASPVQTATTSAKPTEAPAAKSAPPASKPAADWKAEWDKTVAEAKKEGKVVVNGPPGELYRASALAFEKAFPEIHVDFTGADGPIFAPKILAERDGGQYLWDVYLGGATTGLSVLRPRGVLDSLKSVLLLPDVLDNSKWVGGLDNFWMDKEGMYLLGFEAGLQHSIQVNRDFVPESELSSHDQLLDPKWKGKIVSGDLRTAGAQNGSASLMLKAKGEDWLRKFYSQDVVIMPDERANIEALVRGRYPVSVGVKPAALQVFRKEKLADSIKPLAADTEAGAALSTSASHAALINKAPHPNAAKVFVNWFLSSEGQKVFVQVTDLISARADVEAGDAFFRPKLNVKYFQLNQESMLPFKTKAMDIAKETFK